MFNIINKKDEEVNSAVSCEIIAVPALILKSSKKNE